MPLTEAEKSTYPLATPTGESIPFDIGLPEGLMLVDFVTAASGEKILPSDWEVVVFFATEYCVIAFGTGVTLDLTRDVAKVNHAIIPKETPVSLKVPDAKFKVIRWTTDGTLFIQKYRRWQALATEVLQKRV